MSQLRLLIGLLTVSAFAADAKLETLLKGVETRYNRAKTLQVLFQEDYTPPSKPKRSEKGILMLRKPGRMRWDYSQPAGKLLVSDNKFLWVYTPSDNHVQKAELKETDDTRAPLAFLLGHMDFSKEFKNIQGKPEGVDTRVTAEPKGDSLPYSDVQFLITPDFRIREVKWTSFDNAVTAFVFDQERLEPSLDPKLFVFTMPKGAELVEGGQQ